MLIDNDMHDNEDMMMILMILLTIMLMKSNYDRCLLARTDQQRGPLFLTGGRAWPDAPGTSPVGALVFDAMSG